MTTNTPTPSVEAILLQAIVDYLMAKRPRTTENAVRHAAENKYTEVPRLTNCMYELLTRDNYFWGRIDYKKFGLDSDAKNRVKDMKGLAETVVANLMIVY